MIEDPEATDGYDLTLATFPEPPRWTDYAWVVTFSRRLENVGGRDALKNLRLLLNLLHAGARGFKSHLGH